MNTSLSHTFRGVSRADEPAGRSPVRPPSPVCGLSASEVERSRALYGSNVLSPGKRPGFMRCFLGNLNDPIVRILLAALVVNTAFSLTRSGWAESLGIALTVLVSAFVTTYSEQSSGASFEKLYSALGSTPCRVLRDGEERECPLTALVRYDIVLLRPGDTVPADGILARGSVRCDESALTGESRAVPKTASPAALSACRRGEDPLRPGDPCSVFRGSHVTEGDAAMLVLRIGDGTLYGSIAGELGRRDEESPLKRRLSVLAKTISKIGYLSAAVVALVHLIDAFWFDAGQNTAVALMRLSDPRLVFSELLQAAAMAISVLVVAVPEGLPMMITVVLSSNMKRMMKSGVLVRRLVGIETAGCLDLLFTDKTGTLTTGRLEAEEVFTPWGAFSKIGACPPLLGARLRENALACAAGANRTEAALNVFAGVRPSVLSRRAEESIPFDSERKFTAARMGERVYVRGAPEVLLPACRDFLAEDGRRLPLTPKVRAELERAIGRRAAGSFRLILHAEASSDALGALRQDAASVPLVLVALSVLRDEIRPEVPAAVEECRRAGIRVVMITGDNAETAAAVARACSILPAEGSPACPDADAPLLLDGQTLRSMEDEALSACLERLAVISRVTPTDKSRLVRLAKAAGHIVGMTGDGVNDAPALKAADVGFAMGSGTDVAREAGDIVITDDNFVSITKAVLYGRTIFSSIRKFIAYQLTMNFAAVGVSVLGTMLGIESPVTVIQMLWVNMIMDTLGSLAFAGEPALEDIMREPPVGRTEPILTRGMLFQTLFTGSFAIALSMFFLLSPSAAHFFGGTGVYRLTLFFALFVFMGIGIALCARTPRIRLFANLSKNRTFAVIMPAVAAIQLLIVYFGGTVFRCVPLRPRDLALCALFALTVIPADTIRKCVGRIAGDAKRGKSSG